MNVAPSSTTIRTFSSLVPAWVEVMVRVTPLEMVTWVLLVQDTCRGAPTGIVAVGRRAESV